MKLAKTVKVIIFFNRLVFPVNFNRKSTLDTDIDILSPSNRQVADTSAALLTCQSVFEDNSCHLSYNFKGSMTPTLFQPFLKVSLLCSSYTNLATSGSD